MANSSSQENRSMGDLFGGDAKGGWLGLDKMGLDTLAQAKAPIDIGILGIGAATPYPLGAYCMNAPDAIRGAQSWPGILNHHDFDIHGITPSDGVLPPSVSAVDFGNLDVIDSALADDTAANRAQITAAVSAMLSHHITPFIFGGDDSIPTPVLAAFKDDVSILQIDAHIDWRDDVGGERLGLSSTMRRLSEMDHVGKIVQFGARGIGSARGDDLRDALDYGVSFHSKAMLDEDGGIARAIDDLPKDKPVYIALDIDSLDPAIMPAVIGPAQGGLNYRQMLEIFTRVADHAPIAGFNLVEFMPEQDINNKGAAMASRVALSMFGLLAKQRAIRPPQRP